MERRTLMIGHLFPELLNMYGDKGNIQTLFNRLLWRGMDARVIEFGLEDEIDFEKLDIVLIGGGSDREQKLACERLQSMKESLSAYVESDGVLLALCGAYPMLGKEYPCKNGLQKGLGILDIDTEMDAGRHIGNVVISAAIGGESFTVVGFENHSGKTHIGSLEPLGTVLCGFGNNGGDKTCGVTYKNVIGTYLHGPLLPKNPKLADKILSRALARKYGEAVTLPPLCDKAEEEAHNYIVNRFMNR